MRLSPHPNQQHVANAVVRVQYSGHFHRFSERLCTVSRGGRILDRTIGGYCTTSFIVLLSSLYVFQAALPHRGLLLPHGIWLHDRPGGTRTGLPGLHRKPHDSHSRHPRHVSRQADLLNNRRMESLGDACGCDRWRYLCPVCRSRIL